MAQLDRKSIITDDALRAPYDLADGFEKVVSILNEVVNTAAKASASLNSGNQSTSAHKKTVDELSRAQQKLVTANSQIAKELAKVNVQTAERNKKIKEEAKQSLGLVGAYERLTKELNQARRAYKDLAASGTATTKELKAQQRVVDDLDRKVKTIDYSVGQFQRNVGNYPKTFQVAGNAFRSFIAAFGLVGGVYLFANAIKDAIKLTIEYERQNSTLKAVLTATDSEMTRLRQTQLKLGASTEFTSKQVAELQTEFAKLGFPTDDIENMTASTLDAALAMGSDLGDQAKLTGATLKAFGLSSKETARVNDVLAKSTASSALDFSKLEASISTVAPVARAYGFTIEETVALLGELSNAGFDASTAATATRNIFLNLADTNGKLAKSLKEPVKDLPSLLRGLDQLNSEGIDLAKAFDLTDKRSVAAFSTFLRGTKSIEALTNTLQNAEGSARDMARIMGDNLKGDTLQMTSAWEGLILALLSGDSTFNRVLRSIVQLTTSFLQFITPVQDATKYIRDEQNELNILVTRIESTNINQEERNKLIEELQQKYPSFLQNLDSESITHGELAKRLKEANNQYLLKIALAKKNEEIEKKINEISKTALKISEKRTEAAGIIAIANRVAAKKGLEDARLEIDFDENREEIKKKVLKAEKAGLLSIHQRVELLRLLVDTDDLFIDGQQNLLKQYDNQGKSLDKLKLEYSDLEKQLKSILGIQDEVATTDPIKPPEKDIKSTLDVQKLIVEGQIKANNDIVADDKKSYDERRKAAEANFKLNSKLAQLERDIAIEKLKDDEKDANKKQVIYQKYLNAVVEAERDKNKVLLGLNEQASRDSSALIVSRLQAEIRVNKNLLENDKLSFSERNELLVKILEDRRKILDTQYQKDVTDAGNNVDRLLAVQEKYNSDLKELAVESADGIRANFKRGLEGVEDETKRSAARQLEALDKQVISGEKTIKDYQQERRLLEINGNILVLEAQRDFIRQALEEARKRGDETLKLEKELADKEVEITKEKADAVIASNDEILKSRQKTQELVNSSLQLTSVIETGLIDNRLAKLDQESQAIEAKREKELAAAEGNAAAQADINKKFDRKQAEIKRKQAKADRDKALFNIAIQTAQNVVEAFPNPVAIAFALALGAAESAFVLSRKIPEFWMGSDHTPDTFIAGDRGSEIVAHQKGLFVTKQPTLFTGMEGATVVPHSRTEEILGSIDDARLNNSILNGFAVSKMSSARRNDDLLLQEVKQLNSNLKKSTSVHQDVVRIGSVLYESRETNGKHRKFVRSLSMGDWYDL